MERLWAFIVILGPILFLAVVIYVWYSNRKAGRANKRQADQGARELREEMAEEPKKTFDP